MEEVKVAESRALEVVAREPDPKLSENALRVLQKRYLKKDDKGRVIETPKELFARVAWNLAQAERNYGATEAQVEETARRFFRIISTLEFLPNSPTLMNAGLELQLLSACFVLPVDDSLVGIFDALKQQARSEEHTSELQSHSDLVCRLLLEKKKKQKKNTIDIKTKH